MPLEEPADRDPSIASSPRWASTARILSGVVAALGGAVLVGWATDVDLVKSVLPGEATMKPNAALGFVACGLATFALVEHPVGRFRRRLASGLAAFALVVGALTFFEYVLDVRLGVDTLLFRDDPAAPNTSHPGRMAPTTALGFVLAGLALLAFDRPALGEATTEALAAPAALIAIWAVTGYLYGAEYPSGLPAYTQMAIHTAVGFTVLFAALVSARPDRGLAALLRSPTFGGAVARQLLPVGALLPILIGWVRVRGEQAGIFGLEFGSALFATALSAALASVILWTALVLDRADRARRDAEAGRLRAAEEVKELNASLERRIRERTAELEAVNRDLDSFAYSVSHDLRSPLRAMDGFSRILLEDHSPSLDGAGKHHLERVRENAKRMGDLIDALLAFSRQGRKTIDRRPVDVRALVGEIVEQMTPPARRVEIVLGELPACEADPALLRQVFANLLDNALKFTRRRDGARIEVGCSGNGSAEPTFFVRDNGTGFDPRYADRIFGVFQRLHRAEDFEGTGVGLASVHRIVTRHGGRVWAEGVVDQGATFYFTLGRGGAS